MLHSCIGCTKNPFIIPKYAYIVETYDNIWKEEPNTRYPIIWKLGYKNLYSSIDANINNQVDFENIDVWGGFRRLFLINMKEDKISEAFAYVYCESTKELLIFGLFAQEARFGGIVIQPMANFYDDYHFFRHKYLMNKWRRLTPLIGKWAIFLIQLHNKVI